MQLKLEVRGIVIYVAEASDWDSSVMDIRGQHAEDALTGRCVLERTVRVLLIWEAGRMLVLAWLSSSDDLSAEAWSDRMLQP